MWIRRLLMARCCPISRQRPQLTAVGSGFALAERRWTLPPQSYASGPSNHMSTQEPWPLPQEDQTKRTERKGGPGESTDVLLRENRKIIAKLLAIDETDVGKVPFKMISEEKAVHTLEVLQNFGFSLSSIHLYPELLVMSGSAVENYVRIMQETGFPSIREVFILRFRTVCKQTVPVLQQKLSLPDFGTILKQYCAELEEEEAFLHAIVSKLPKDTSKLTLFDLRNVMMAEYLGKLLSRKPNESFETFTKYPRMYYRCFNWVKRNFRILKEFGFTNEKIKSHAYLLHTDPNNLTKIIKIKSLAGIDMKKIGTLRPKILMSSYKSLLDIEKSLVSHGISFESVHKYPEIFTLSASTIEQRLHEMDTIPEFQLLKNHPSVARLLYYQNKAKARLEDFRSMQMRVPSLHLLSSDTKRFNKSVSTGDFKVKGVDKIIYLADTFQVDRKRIRESIVRHPHWLDIPLMNIKSVLKCVESLGTFKNEQLIDAIPLLLYPKDKVEEQAEIVKKSGDARPSDEYFLQMVLYHIERLHHFTGDAAWPDKAGHQDDEEDEGVMVDNKPSEMMDKEAKHADIS